MYINLREVKISDRQRKLAITSGVLAGASLVLGLLGALAKDNFICLVGFEACYALVMLGFVILLPYVSLSVAFFLAPVGLYVFGNVRPNYYLHVWWFWVLTAASYGIGTVLYALFEKRWRK